MCDNDESPLSGSSSGPSTSSSVDPLRLTETASSSSQPQCEATTSESPIKPSTLNFPSSVKTTPVRLFPSSNKSPCEPKTPNKMNRKMSRMSSSKSPSLPANMDKTTISELFLSVHNFLRNSNCIDAANTLREELDRKQLLAPRLHPLQHGTLPETFDHFAANRGSGVVDLVQSIARLGELTNQTVPIQQNGPLRLSAAIPFAVNRLFDNIEESIPRPLKTLSGKRLPFKTPLTKDLMRNCRYGMPMPANPIVSNEIASAYKQHTRICGHQMSIYCVTFDRSGQYVITGADDNLIKVWDAKKCLLRYTFRGHAAEVCDLSVSHENTLLASGSIDRTVRIWSLQTGAALHVFSAHTGSIVSVIFPPFFQDNVRYLISLSYDCTVIFYRWDATTREFDDNRHRYTHKEHGPHKMLSGTTSCGGNFAAFSDTQKSIYVYLMKIDDVVPIATLNDVHADKIDSLVWSHLGLRFMSASSDGIIRVWNFQYNQFQPFDLKLPETALPAPTQTSKKSAYQVNTICWSLDDQYVVASGSDNLLRIWNPRSGKLAGCLKGHEKVVFVLRPHPTNPDLVCSAGYDGFCMIWDLGEQRCIRKLVNLADVTNKLHSIFDLAFSPTGLMVAYVDDVGHVSFAGIVPNESAKRVPKQQFFSTDYLPCEADSQGYPRDSITGLAPHLNDPPELVRIDNIPHDSQWQRAVPGRDRMLAHPGGLIDGFFCPWLHQNIIEPSPNMDKFGLKIKFYATHHLKEYESEVTRQPPVNWSAVSLAATVKKTPAVRRRQQVEVEVTPSALSVADQAAMLPDSDSDDGTYSGESSTRSVTPDSDVDMVGAREDQLLEDENDSDYIEGYDAHETVFRNTNRRRRRQEPEQPTPAPSAPAPPSSNSTRPRRERVERQSSDPREPTRPTVPRSRPVGRHTRANPVADDDPAVAAQRRRQRQRRARRSSETEEVANVEAGPSAPTPPPPSRTTARSPSVHMEYPEWANQFVPRRFPYLAQIGDHVVYFPQGHTNYLTLVKAERLFKVLHSDYPRPEFNCEEFAIVEDLKYAICGKIHLTVLTLAFTDPHGRRTNQRIKVRYHDLENVPDFFILREYFDLSVGYEFKTGDMVEAIIDDKWWVGTLQERALLDQGSFSGSQFCSVKVLWDNGEDPEHCSPWDLQPQTPGRVSDVDATDEEILAFSAYTPKTIDWPVPDDVLTDGDAAADGAIKWCCDRFCAAVEALNTIPEVMDFCQPVDLGTFQSYASHVPYPMDLEKIVLRFQNRYYRTKRQALRDIQLLAFNANVFNEPTSMIAKNSIQLVETLFTVLEDDSVTEFNAYFMHLVEQDNVTDLLAYKRSLSLTPKQNSDADAVDVDSEPNVRSGAHEAEVWEAESRRILSDMIVEDMRVSLGAEDYDELIEQFPDGDVNDPAKLVAGINALIQQTQNSLDNRRNPLYRELATLSSELDHAFRPVIEKYHRMRNGGRQLRAAAVSALRRNTGGMTRNVPTRNLRQRLPLNYNLDAHEPMDVDLPRRRTLRRGQEIPNYADLQRGSVTDNGYALPRASSRRNLSSLADAPSESLPVATRRSQRNASSGRSDSSAPASRTSRSGPSNSVTPPATRRQTLSRSPLLDEEPVSEVAEMEESIDLPVESQEVPAVESPSSRANDSDYDAVDAEIEDEDDEDEQVVEAVLSSDTEASTVETLNSETSSVRPPRRQTVASRRPPPRGRKRRRIDNTDDELNDLDDGEESSLTDEGSSDGASPPPPTRSRGRKKKPARGRQTALRSRRPSTPEPPSRKRRRRTVAGAARPNYHESDNEEEDVIPQPVITRSGRVNRRTSRYQD